MTDERKFYKTVITFTVLSERPVEGSPLELAQIVSECDEGGFVAHSEWRKTEEIAPVQMATLLYEAGSEPGFFSLDEG